MGSTAALNSAEKSAGASGWIAGEGSSIWMNAAPAATSASSSARRIGTNASAAAYAIAVDLAGSGSQAPGERVRAREGHLQRPARSAYGVAVLGHHAQSVGCGDRLEHLETVLLIVAAHAEPAIGRQRAHADQVAVELRGEEAGPPHLAIADDVDAGLLLVAQRQVDSVGQHLLEIDRSEVATLGGRDAADEPPGCACEPTTLVRRTSVMEHPVVNRREGERPGRIRDEQPVADRRVQASLRHRRTEAIE